MKHLLEKWHKISKEVDKTILNETLHYFSGINGNLVGVGKKESCFNICKVCTFFFFFLYHSQIFFTQTKKNYIPNIAVSNSINLKILKYNSFECDACIDLLT